MPYIREKNNGYIFKTERYFVKTRAHNLKKRTHCTKHKSSFGYYLKTSTRSRFSSSFQRHTEQKTFWKDVEYLRKGLRTSLSSNFKRSLSSVDASATLSDEKWCETFANWLPTETNRIARRQVIS